MVNRPRMKTVNDYLQIVLQSHRQLLNRAYDITSANASQYQSTFRVVHDMILIAYEQIAYGEY